MSLSDRYSCQEHGKKIEQGCVACEVYKDIYELEAERDRLKEHIKLLEEDIKSYQADL